MDFDQGQAMSANPQTTQPDSILLREDREGVATLTLNRPAQFNSLSQAMLGELQKALDAIAADANVRAVVIAGAGKAFCAGHDLKEMRSNRSKDFVQALFDQCSRMMMTIAWMPQPVIAKVHGIATAAGCQLVGMCDLAIASSGARFATSGIRVGLFCATPGVAVSRNVSRKRALEMLLTGEFIDAATALDYGLVNRVVPEDSLEDETRRLINSVIVFPADVIAQGKRLFYKQIGLSIEEAYVEASKAMAANMMLDVTAEGIDAFIAKRPPDWERR
jgi:enoyl-CoA hydratase/carnithine racemase